MTEIIINYPSKSALVQLATALGYYDLVGKVIVAQARLDAGGSYFFNNVGAVEASPGVPAPGLWARAAAVVAQAPSETVVTAATGPARPRKALLARRERPMAARAALEPHRPFKPATARPRAAAAGRHGAAGLFPALAATAA